MEQRYLLPRAALLLTNVNAVFGNNASVQRPMRVGVFATGATTRAQCGASYYGAMEVSGNQWERPLPVGNTQGRA
jgi:hypothetical protein